MRSWLIVCCCALPLQAHGESGPHVIVNEEFDCLTTAVCTDEGACTPDPERTRVRIVGTYDHDIGEGVERYTVTTDTGTYPGTKVTPAFGPVLWADGSVIHVLALLSPSRMLWSMMGLQTEPQIRFLECERVLS